MTTTDTPATVTGHITWERFAHNWTTEFIEGYRVAVEWLKTCPARSEAHEIHDIHTRRQEDAEAAESTYYIDVEKIPSLVEHCHIAVLDGPEYKADMIAMYGDSFKVWDPPKRMVSWPGAHAWFEGFERAVAHVVDE